MTENIVTGKKYRILTDAANDIWDRISFWAKASDVQYDDNTTAEANKAVAILKRNASYTIGTVAYEPSAPSWVLLRCTQAGTTAAVIPSTYSTISSVGTVITDGTARFTVYDVRPSDTLSNSEYQVPAMSLVNGLDAELTANGNKFYFDYQNDTYGYNTSASREAATFVPFGGSTANKYYSISAGGSGSVSDCGTLTIGTPKTIPLTGDSDSVYFNVEKFSQFKFTFTGSLTTGGWGGFVDGVASLWNAATGVFNDVSSFDAVMVTVIGARSITVEVQ